MARSLKKRTICRCKLPEKVDAANASGDKTGY